MGIQINGITDTILATDGSLVVSGQQLTGVTDISASGIVTATQGYVVGTGASIFSPAANTLALGTNGSERIRITSAGFMGLGMASPSAPLDVVTGSSGAIFRYSSASTWLHLLPGDANGNIALRFRANSGNAPDLLFQNDAGTEIARITNSGRLAIGTTDIGDNLTISAANYRGLTLQTATSTDRPTIYFRNTGSASACHIQSLGQNLIFGRNPASDYGSHTETARIDASGRLLVGTSSVISNGYGGTAGLLQVAKNDYLPIGFFTYSNTAGETGYCPYVELNRARGTQASPSAVSSGDDLGIINFYGYDSSAFSRAAYIKAVVDGGVSGAGDMPGRLVFSTTADGASSPTERMRITSGGILSNKTTNIGSEVGQGWSLTAGGEGVFTVPNICLYINRTSTDGTLIAFFQDNTQEGSISVSGTTVSYNGAHLSRWSQLPSGAERTEILRGSVLSNINEMCEWTDEENEQLNRMKVSDVEGDRNVSGVFQGWDDDDDTYTNDFYCAMTGDFIIRIGDGVTVERGDLLMSAGDGTAKPQDDDIIRSKTIAKVTSTNVSCTYDDGSYCVPCVLMAC